MREREFKVEENSVSVPKMLLKFDVGVCACMCILLRVGVHVCMCDCKLNMPVFVCVCKCRGVCKRTRVTVKEMQRAFSSNGWYSKSREFQKETALRAVGFELCLCKAV